MINRVKDTIQSKIPLKSDRIQIRKFKETDIDNFWYYQSDDSLYKYLLCNKIKDYDTAEGSIQSLISFYKVHKITRYVIANKDKNEMLGVISMYPNNLDNGRIEVEIGYWIGIGHRNKGIATEALGLVVNMLKHIKGIERLTLQVMQGNTYSLKIAKRYGFICVSKDTIDNKIVYKLIKQI